MRAFLCKSNLVGLILAAMAAGVCCTPAVAVTHNKQSASASEQKKAGSTRSTSSKSSSTATAKKATSASSTKSTPAATAKKTGTSARSKASSRRKAAKKVKGQETPTTDRISEIQEKLASKGVLSDTPSGKWDDSTVEAMKKFQTSQGLVPTGKLDALTLQKLGLGSQTAGVAAPVAPPNSINRLKNPHATLDEPSSSEEQPHN